MCEYEDCNKPSRYHLFVRTVSGPNEKQGRSVVSCYHHLSGLTDSLLFLDGRRYGAPVEISKVR